MKRPELLAPAGNYENAYFAMKYGADAIYQGLEGFSLRRTTKAELSVDELIKCATLAHTQGKKHYLALNMFAHEEDIIKLRAISHELKAINTDAFILSDPGMFLILKEQFPEAEFHLSTQANTLNSASVNFWEKQGISRVILARELSKEDISTIREQTQIGLELFVHGAMCMSYSGRCHLSKYFLHRDANRGECAQPCRWEYTQKTQNPNDKIQNISSLSLELQASSQGSFIEIEEDEKGTYILNSKDLCLVEKIPELIEIGIDSFKVEGRNKTSYYVANVVRVYRKVIDECLQGKLDESTLQWAKQELAMVSHRDYSTGFFDGEKGSFNFDSSGYIKDAKMVGIASSDGSTLEIEVRDKIEAGEEITIIVAEQGVDITIIADKIIDKKTGENIQSAHNGSKIIIPIKTSKFEKLIVRKQA